MLTFHLFFISIGHLFPLAPFSFLVMCNFFESTQTATRTFPPKLDNDLFKTSLKESSTSFQRAPLLNQKWSHAITLPSISNYAILCYNETSLFTPDFA